MESVADHAKIARDYQKKFWQQAVRYLPQHVLLVATGKLRLHGLSKRLVRRYTTTLQAKPLQPYSDAEVRAYKKNGSTAKLWHGTGRKQYRGGKVIDIFATIVHDGQLNPLDDAYAVLIGGNVMHTISTTPLRIIARCYADTHGKGENEPYRYGTSLWWVSFYYSLFYAEIFTRSAATVARNWKRWSTASADENGERLWGKKVARHAKSVWDVFGTGSDITGNYPILFGIRHVGTIAVLPKAMAKAEVRLLDPVRLPDISHIEVPAAQKVVTETLLQANGWQVPVFPLELGEYVASLHSVAELLDKDRQL